tara:strand:+ start:93 stop:368 length:276 start_codon:yes stop_codon:yes gene_type:complete
VASGEALEKPLKEPGFDYEGEIALIVGKRCRNVSVEQAPDHVAGFAPFNDGSARFYQVSNNQLPRARMPTAAEALAHGWQRQTALMCMRWK